ncbi:hypothetical protein [Sphaerisporangium sp. TRM90804]|uniref:hypothetical protein n=1 Tax=Sphaerisporangium sp. TRM90804 TaxID=3031113 RepID=UPI00244A980D|nr:hypothetical protein [Sphaerisporangium sp. TRM90804]MDH2426134.1 hypothetical protein [Sphaerisporangium sp. TRM90804]
MNKGWDMYLHTLDQYLTHFPGQLAVVVYPVHAPEGLGLATVWTVLERGLGLAGPVSRGDNVRLTPAGFEPIEGIVDHASPDFLGVRTGDGLYRFSEGVPGTVMLAHHLFTDDVDPAETEQAWQEWLTDLFA